MLVPGWLSSEGYCTFLLPGMPTPHQAVCPSALLATAPLGSPALDWAASSAKGSPPLDRAVLSA